MQDTRDFIEAQGDDAELDLYDQEQIDTWKEDTQYSTHYVKLLGKRTIWKDKSRAFSRKFKDYTLMQAFNSHVTKQAGEVSASSSSSAGTGGGKAGNTIAKGFASAVSRRHKSGPNSPAKKGVCLEN
eukprot:CAMPEP_0114997374 /NCGR_PEP_ID=MMETSP0216-20121206/14862_1 /TAXON_ID=223996 /ORGANISM="Protocruzia adherens, Strain Boccale" /LENGTH=126 /DNA_ID=CAMNT_0002361745 /DNA_START=278 /DNA_END=658 /DNA_ORIENTATION=-